MQLTHTVVYSHLTSAVLLLALNVSIPSTAWEEKIENMFDKLTNEWKLCSMRPLEGPKLHRIFLLKWFFLCTFCNSAFWALSCSCFLSSSSFCFCSSTAFTLMFFSSLAKLSSYALSSCSVYTACCSNVCANKTEDGRKQSVKKRKTEQNLISVFYILFIITNILPPTHHFYWTRPF